MLILEKLKQFIILNQRSISLFLIVGLTAMIFYFALFTLLWKVIHVNYKVAVSIAFITTVIMQFLLNRRLTFKNRENNIIGQVVKCFTVAVINYFITILVVKGIVEVLSWSPYMGIIISIAVTVTINYLMSKFWVFKQNINTIEEI